MNSLHAWGKQINHAFSSSNKARHNGHSNHGASATAVTHNGAPTKLSHSASSDSGCSEIHTSSSEQECHKLGIGGHHHHHHHLHHHHHPHSHSQQQQQQPQQPQPAAHHRPSTPQTNHRSPTSPPAAVNVQAAVVSSPPAPTPPTDAPFYLPPWQAMISVNTFVDFVKNRDIGRIKYAIREADFNLDTYDEVGHLYILFHPTLYDFSLFCFHKVKWKAVK